MRLIDADEIDFNEVFVGASKFAEDTRQAGKMLIDAQPTAYDVDKVVEELEVGLANECVYERDQKVYTEAIRCAIEIVKGGGVNE